MDVTTTHGLELGHISLYLKSLLALLACTYLAKAFYNILFHPLSNYPGPKIAGATPLLHTYKCVVGNEVRWIQELHEKYGEIVRFSPTKLSFIHPQAWKDIYGYRTGGRAENPKDSRFFPKDINGEDSIITEGVAEHGRVRKIFSNAFSNKALQLQEDLIQGHVQKLIRNIKRDITSDPEKAFDIVKVYNYTTFDIMGDLAFGEPLGMLDTSSYTPWVAAIFANIKFSIVRRAVLEYPWFGLFLKAITPEKYKKKAEEHFRHSVDRVDGRIKKGKDIGKPDIWKLVLGKDEEQLSLSKMHSNASIFMIAGTETTATLLSGLTFFLLKNPDKLKKVIDEVRPLPEADLSLEVLPRLPYLNACFEEAMRMYPPVPAGLPREVGKGGNKIMDKWVPEGTSVIVPQYVAFQSKINFKDPTSFVPERWLPGSEYDNDRKDVFQPFSFGPRNCLGKNLAYHEMRIIFASVIWNFDLELCPESSSWSEQQVFVLWEKHPLMVKARAIR
ncbi:cytochrome P450 [Phaeosphaeriaceae sp. PMI808]|nr:cytochrome P450 [Phaeosphaeriaceae sp. PMI808]